MSEAEALEAAAIHSVSHQGVNPSDWRVRPFRAPHHTASAIALVGGGPVPSPGEISLAHRGVLFLDELPEFNRHVLEVLREPLESGRILISRAGRQAEFPACFQLICAMNPCPCGRGGDASGECGCSADQVRRYRDRVSAPLLDRIDLQVTVPRPPPEVLRPGSVTGEASTTVRGRVEAARHIQAKRSGRLNARLSSREVARYCDLGAKSWDLLATAAERRGLSPRACHRALKVARTIADLDGSAAIAMDHLAEALILKQAAGITGNALT